MKVLHVTPSFYPATWWGGPIWSTKAICDGIAALPDMTLRVLTTDAASPERGDRVTPAALPYRVHYARRIGGHSVAPGLLARLPAAIAWADVVHLTATYNMPTLPTLALANLFGRPVVWSPRGALQATAGWAQAPRRRLKHRFERLAQGLRGRKSILHVTSLAEGAQSVARLQGIATTLIPNCVSIPNIGPRQRAPGEGLRLLYLGRLHPKKGLARLFQAMTRLPDNVHLDIYGTGMAFHVTRLLQQASGLGTRVRFMGHVEGAAKRAAFANADLFVLPSHSENFGIAVAEALAHGVPVITTSATPWQDLALHGCGACIDLAQEDLADTIAQLWQSDLAAMGARGRAWMIRDFSADAMVAAFARLYRDLDPARGRKVTA